MLARAKHALTFFLVYFLYCFSYLSNKIALIEFHGIHDKTIPPNQILQVFYNTLYSIKLLEYVWKCLRKNDFELWGRNLRVCNVFKNVCKETYMDLTRSHDKYRLIQAIYGMSKQFTHVATISACRHNLRMSSTLRHVTIGYIRNECSGS